jgi:sulfoquinovose isomerase
MKAWIDLPSHHEWLESESQRLLAFGRHFPAPGGGAHWLDDDGDADTSRPVFTWITARMAHVHALAHLRGTPGAATLAAHALAGLTGPLHDSVHGGWFNAVGPDGVPVAEKTAYAHAFVVLAASTGTVADLPGARALLDDALAVYLERFWDDAAGLSRDEWDRTWTVLDPYRGVNANMHSVEALLAATDATGDPAWRDRALRIATHVVHEWARGNDWRIIEHFDADWRPLLELNADRPDDPFKPYGATIGHGLEWSRLVLHLHASLGASAADWMVPAAQALYARAVADGWAVDGAPGFVYTTDWSGVPVVRSRMHWVPAEAIGAAAALYLATGDMTYDADYRRWWDYVADHVMDRERGSWHHELDAANRPTGLVWPGKADLYHAYQATLIPRSPLAPGLALAQRDGLV